MTAMLAFVFVKAWFAVTLKSPTCHWKETEAKPFWFDMIDLSMHLNSGRLSMGAKKVQNCFSSQKKSFWEITYNYVHFDRYLIIKSNPHARVPSNLTPELSCNISNTTTEQRVAPISNSRCNVSWSSGPSVNTQQRHKHKAWGGGQGQVG